MKFYGIVKDGRLTLYLKEEYKAYIAKYEDKEVSVEVKRKVKHRSTPQNDHYWGFVVAPIAEYTGHTSQEIHECLRYLYLCVDESAIVRVSKSTTDLSTVEFMEYIENCRQWALDKFNMTIKLPNEPPLPTHEN